MRCNACQTENAPNRRFCSHCGKPLQAEEQPPVAFCKSCGADLKGKRFCPACGADNRHPELTSTPAPVPSNPLPVVVAHDVAESSVPEVDEPVTPDASLDPRRAECETSEKVEPPPDPIPIPEPTPATEPVDFVASAVDVEDNTVPAAPSVLAEPTMEAPVPPPSVSSAESVPQNASGGGYCKACGSALGGNRFCPQCGADNLPSTTSDDPDAPENQSHKSRIGLITGVIVVALLAVAGYFGYRYWMTPSALKPASPVAVTASPAVAATISSATASTASTISVLAPTSSTVSVVSSAAPTASASSVVTPPPAAVPAEPVVNNPVVAPAPAKPVAPIAPHYYAAPQPAPENGPSTKEQMQKILSPFGGNN